ncbi:hypothetical protein IWX90DRAFT_443366 [Phyllosticta citrichinensis]|uniref:Uncharacterized protein n=1 Tax=Phyllosticta citrichinensis TaxID=1130410 RepID=A0ABR1XIL3_9PEZI
MGPPSSLLSPPQSRTSRSPSPSPDSSRLSGFLPLRQRATPPTQTGESIGSSSAATTSAAAMAVPPLPPPTVLDRQQELSSQNLDLVPSTANRNSAASAAIQAPGCDRQEYIALLRAKQKEIAAKKGAASAATTTSAPQSQPTLQPEQPVPAPASQPNVESQTQTQTQHEEPPQSATEEDEREEGGVVEEQQQQDQEEEGEGEEVTLEMKPNSTRSLLSRFE